MTVLQSISFGIVQGITEFLPVSSSGHLSILRNLFGVKTDTGLLFDILLHIGTLLAVLAVYHRDIWKMLRETCFMLGDLFLNLRIFLLNRIHKTAFRYRRVIHNSYRRFVVLILISTIPTGIIGILAEDLVLAANETLLIPGICLLITAVLLLMADTAQQGRNLPRDVSIQDAVTVGLVQGLATLPGLSRSGATIAACILCGMDRRFAVKYSFILSVPAVLGAALWELQGVQLPAADAEQTGIYLAGMFAAAVVGYVCIKTMLLAVKKKKFKYFSVYCLLAGAFAIAGHFFL